MVMIEPHVSINMSVVTGELFFIRSGTWAIRGSDPVLLGQCYIWALEATETQNYLVQIQTQDLHMGYVLTHLVCSLKSNVQPPGWIELQRHDAPQVTLISRTHHRNHCKNRSQFYGDSVRLLNTSNKRKRKRND